VYVLTQSLQTATSVSACAKENTGGILYIQQTKQSKCRGCEKCCLLVLVLNDDDEDDDDDHDDDDDDDDDNDEDDDDNDLSLP